MLNRINVNGVELEYDLHGTSTGEPVVLLHWGVGTDGPGRSWTSRHWPTATSYSVITGQASAAAAP